jgi:uncharacterized iron-regulated protein
MKKASCQVSRHFPADKVTAMPDLHDTPRRLASLAGLAALLALGGCALPSPRPEDWNTRLGQWAGTSVILLGEQHDLDAHQRWEADTVRRLARGRTLAAVVIEMAPRGSGTGALPNDAGEAQVQAALSWQEKTWAWRRYREVVMAAVRAGVPVLGGNLPRERMRAAMGEARFDTHLPASGWQLQRQAIRDGHCGLLPEAQWTPMARIQMARDESMARTVQAAVAQLRREGQSVLLISGRGHSRADIGVPTWLDGTPYKVAVALSPNENIALDFKADWWQLLPAGPGEDHCARLRAQWRQDTP